MTRTFRRAGDGIRATFRSVEVDVLRSLHGQLVDTLRRGDPDDPVIRRLFPPPVLGDPDAAQQVRDRFGADLLASRLTSLDTIIALLDRGTPHRGGLRVDLVDDEPLLVLGVLNDVRLAIGARIDVEALDRDAVGDDDPVAYLLAVMDHLGLWQEQLLAVLDPAETG